MQAIKYNLLSSTRAVKREVSFQYSDTLQSKKTSFKLKKSGDHRPKPVSPNYTFYGEHIGFRLGFFRNESKAADII